MNADIEELDEADQAGVREVSPVQFFQGDNALADRDFRPQVLKSSPEEVNDLVLDPSQAHDPHVSPIPEREYSGSIDDETGTAPKSPFSDS